MLKHRHRLSCFSSFLSLAFLLTPSKGFPGKYELSWAPDEPPRLIMKQLKPSVNGNATKDKIETSRSALLQIMDTLEGKTLQKKAIKQLMAELQYPEILIGQNLPQQFPPQPADSVLKSITEVRDKLQKMKNQFVSLPACEFHLSSLESYYAKFIRQLLTQATSEELWEKYYQPKVKLSLPLGPFRILQEDAQKLSLGPGPLQEPSFYSPHEVLNYFLFSKQKILNGLFAGREDGVPFDEEGSYVSSLSLGDFLRKVDNSSKEDRKKLYDALSPSSFARAFVISFLTEPLCAHLPPFEIRYIDKSEKRGFITFSSSPPPSSQVLQISSPSAEDTWQPLYGFKNPLYLLQSFMKEELPFSIRQFLVNLFPRLEILRYGHKLNEVFLKEDSRLPLLPFSIERVYERWQDLTACLKDHPHETYQSLLYRLQPLVVCYFQKKIQEHPDALANTYKAIQASEPDLLSLAKEFYPQYPFDKDKFRQIYGQRKTTQNFLTLTSSQQENTTYVSQKTLQGLLDSCDLSHCLSYHTENAFKLLHWVSHYFPYGQVPHHPSWTDQKIWQDILQTQFEKIKEDKNKNSQLKHEHDCLVNYALGLDINVNEKMSQSKQPHLHKIIIAASSEEDILSLVKTLMQSGENLQALDAENKSPLDCALERKFYQVAALFIEAGAGDALSYDIGFKFFQEFSDQPKTPEFQVLQKLLERNSTFAWKVFWDSLSSLPISEDNLTIQTVSLGESVLPIALVDQLFPLYSNHRQLKGTEPYGNAAVARIEWKNLFSIYFKETPAFPGLEYATHRLMNKMIGFGSPFSEFVVIDKIPYLISQGTKGKNLREVLQEDPTLKTIHWNGKKQVLNWDEESLSQFIIMSMILNPGNGKADNYAVQEHPNKPGKFRLIGVNNEQSFVPGVATESSSGELIQVKCLPFCFPEMQSIIPASVKDLFASKEPYEILVSWLKELEEYHTKLAKIKNYTQRKISSLNLQITPLRKTTYYGVPFVPNMLGRLYERMEKIHQIFNDPHTLSSLTHAQLLRKVDKLLARKYTSERQETILDHFKRIETTAEAIESFTTFQGYLESIGLKQAINNKQEIGPSTGLLEMLTKAKNLAWEGMASDIKSFEKLLTPKDRYQFLREKVHFSRLNEPGVQEWLKVISTTDTPDLAIVNCPTLSTGMIISQQILLQHLERLTLTNCKSIKGELLISSLVQYSKSLQLLDLSETSIQHFGIKSSILRRRQVISFQFLRSLILNQCNNLKTIALDAPLERLEVKNCLLLKKINLQQNSLKRLAVEGATQLLSEWINGWIQKKAIVTLDKETARGEYAEILRIIPSYPSKKIKTLKIKKKWVPGSFNFKTVLLLPFLRSLNLEDNKIRVKGVKVLASSNLSALTELKLDSNSIRSEGAKILASGNLSSLTSLSLSCNNIEDEGAKALAFGNLSSLTSVNLFFNNIGDEGAKALAFGNLSSLLTLILNNNRIGDEGVKALALGNLSSLLTLSLNDNRIGDEGIKAFALGNLSALTALKLNCNSIGDEGVEALASGNLSILRVLNLIWNGIGIKGVKALANGNLTALTALKLDDNIGDKGAKALASGNLFALTSLKLTESNIGCEGVKALASGNLSALTLLNLSYNRIGDEGAKMLASGNLPALTSLNLRSTGIGTEGAKALASGNLPALTSLVLENNNIGKTWKFIKKILERNEQRLKEKPSFASLSEKSPSLSSASDNANTYSRMNIDYENDWLYTGLSIDGEGMQGLMLALMLEHLEIVASKPLYKIFDYIGGTSIGGVLGMGIVATYDGQNPRHQVSEFVKLFKEHGQRIFPPKEVLETFKNPEGVFQSRYSPASLEILLKDYFQDLTLKDVLTSVMVTGVVPEANEAFIFDSQRALLDDSQNFYLRSIGRVTSAPPTFFPSTQIWNVKGTETYTINNGSMEVNDPTPLICTRLSEMALDGHLNADHFFTLSLGPGELMPFYTPAANAELRNFKGRGMIIETFMNTPRHHIGEYTQQQLQGKYLRLQPELFWNWKDFRQIPPAPVRNTFISKIPLDKAKHKYLKLYEVAARHKALKIFGEKDAPSDLVRWLQENTDRKYSETLDPNGEQSLNWQLSKLEKEESNFLQNEKFQDNFLNKNIKDFYNINLNKKKIKLRYYKSPDDGDCGYWSLETTRKKAAQELWKNSHREEIRALVAPEIYDIFTQLPMKMRQNQTYQEIIREEETLDEETRVLVTTINDLLGRAEGRRWSKKELVEYLTSLLSLSEEQQNALRSLQDNTERVRVLEKKKMAYCTQEDIFKDFVAYFIKPSTLKYKEREDDSNWLNYSDVIEPDGNYRTSSADAIAFLKKKNLIIINLNEEIKHQYIIPNNNIENTLFLLHIENYHFDALKLESKIDLST